MRRWPALDKYKGQNRGAASGHSRLLGFRPELERSAVLSIAHIELAGQAEGFRLLQCMHRQLVERRLQAGHARTKEAVDSVPRELFDRAHALLLLTAWRSPSSAFSALCYSADLTIHCPPKPAAAVVHIYQSSQRHIVNSIRRVLVTAVTHSADYGMPHLHSAGAALTAAPAGDHLAPARTSQSIWTRSVLQAADLACRRDQPKLLQRIAFAEEDACRTMWCTGRQAAPHPA